MTEEKQLTVRPTMPDVMTLGATLAKSGYFQDARDAAQAVVKVLAGQELGLGPVASMTGIYIVKGRVTLSANVMAAVVKRSGRYNYKVTRLDDTGCSITFYEGKTELGASTFTADDAKRAELGGDNYRKFPRNMYFSRALSNGVKWYCPDVTNGPVYTPDELGEVVDGETGEVISPGMVKTSAPQPKAPELPKLSEVTDLAAYIVAVEPGTPPKVELPTYTGPTEPSHFFGEVNKETGFYYRAIQHLANAIKEETGRTAWPATKDVAGWAQCWDAALKHAKKMNGEHKTDPAPADPLPLVDDSGGLLP